MNETTTAQYRPCHSGESLIETPSGGTPTSIDGAKPDVCAACPSPPPPLHTQFLLSLPSNPIFVCSFWKRMTYSVLAEQVTCTRGNTDHSASHRETPLTLCF